MLDPLLVQFPGQFRFTPIISHKERLRSHRQTAVGGMGGSPPAAGLLNAISPKENFLIHRDYGLPPLSALQKSETLFIASSYSGNTEETLDFARQAATAGFAVAAVT